MSPLFLDFSYFWEYLNVYTKGIAKQRVLGSVMTETAGIEQQ